MPAISSELSEGVRGPVRLVEVGQHQVKLVYHCGWHQVGVNLVTNLVRGVHGQVAGGVEEPGDHLCKAGVAVA